MGELQFYRDLATGVLGILVLIIGYLWKTTADEVKAKLSREEFTRYLDEATKSRENLKDFMTRLTEKMENHERLDVSRFDGITKDFNGGVSRLVDKINEVQINVLTKLNDKTDKVK